MRVLLTGATGFVGPHVQEALEAAGHRVYATGAADRDLTRHRLPDYGQDVVVHLAALVGGIDANVARPHDFWHENSCINSSVLAGCIRDKTPLVAFSSACAYPVSARQPYREADFLSGEPEATNAPYAYAKRALWVAMEAAGRQYGLKGVCLVPANMYGPGDTSSHCIPALIRKMRANPDTLEVFGSPDTARDFLFVKDAAQAVVKAVEKANRAPVLVNIGSGSEVTMGEVVTHLAESLDWHGEVSFTGRLGGATSRIVDTSLAKRFLGWQATTPFAEGIRDTCR